MIGLCFTHLSFSHSSAHGFECLSCTKWEVTHRMFKEAEMISNDLKNVDERDPR